ncbi:hypothetical protein GCM10007874_09380 [Labrys miyagiensis]|uniref:HAD family hydrolase n=1 Tax=Labrys miyagiensis TaxID=346912 RepID=A0ABQ6CI02_9HYPH|nr:HAD-IA family hydrolase [Labrys miyagiensis]GLS17922.1 hypothetical protein GCM10007874_09380 [Labrys miyagiensis]
MSVGDIRLAVENAYGVKMREDWTAKYYALLIDTLGKRARPSKGIEGVIEHLEHVQMPICVASQGPIAKIEASLRSAGLWEHFIGRAYSARAVARPKPAPDLFLHAARTNNVEAGRCAVIEDSATGVHAGVAAGMTVFAYCVDEEKVASMQAVGAIPFRTMDELPGLIGAA